MSASNVIHGNKFQNNVTAGEYINFLFCVESTMEPHDGINKDFIAAEINFRVI